MKSGGTKHGQATSGEVVVSHMRSLFDFAGFTRRSGKPAHQRSSSLPPGNRVKMSAIVACKNVFRTNSSGSSILCRGRRPTRVYKKPGSVGKDTFIDGPLVHIFKNILAFNFSFN